MYTHEQEGARSDFDSTPVIALFWEAAESARENVCEQARRARDCHFERGAGVRAHAYAARLHGHQG